MQLFSRKKALLAASLGALSVLAACGDDVTVSPPPAVLLSISPPSQTLNIGESATFSVQISGGNPASPATLTSCTSSNTTVASATVQNGACRVTAVSAGNATVTATSGTASASASVTVNAAAAAISNLQLSPTTANVAVGQSVTVVPNVARASAGVTTTFAYATSNAAVATVNATTGVITAVAPGIATITVTATGTGTGFTTTSLSGGVTVNVTSAPGGVNTLTVSPTTTSLAVGGTTPLASSVNQPAGAPAAVITYGTNAPAIATVSSTGVITGVAQGQAVITVTATSPAGNGFAASTLSQLVSVTVSPPAQVSIANITQGQTNNPVDITNIQGQIQVALNVTPNGQNINSVQVYLCDVAETDAACTVAGRRVAAQQTFTGSGSNVSTVNLFVNTAEFDAPNFTTGENANTYYKNGLKRLIATATVAGQTLASNNITSLNFNNLDGFAVSNTWRPANRQQGQDGFTYYGGPDTPDALLPGSASGTGRITVVPVLYTQARDIRNVRLALDSDTTTTFVQFCATTVVDSVRPFSTTYGTLATSRDQASLNINCTPSSSLAPNAQPQVSPAVSSSQDNNNDAGPVANRLTTNTALNGVAAATDFRLSTFYRPTTASGYEAIALDYRAPTFTATSVRGGNAAVDSGFVNGAFTFAQVFRCSDAVFFGTNGACFNGTLVQNGGTGVGDDGVGLPVAGTRNAIFDVFLASQVTYSVNPNNSLDSIATFTGAPVASGGLTSTVTSIGLPEATDLTNGAYVLRISETDRLGNRRVLSPLSATSSKLRFGVDLTAPQIVAIANTGAGSTPNIVRTDRDSIFSTLANSYSGTNANNAVFGIRFTDSRSGFFQCTATVNCTGSSDVRGGAYQIVRRRVPSSVSVTNDALVENLVNSSTTSGTTNTINSGIVAQAGTFSGDASIREFYVPIFGDALRASAALAPTILASQAAYYTFSGTIVDRAGNSTTFGSRSVAIDNAAPAISGIGVPAVLQGGATNVAFTPTGSDDLEVIAGDLGLTYPNLGLASGIGAPVAGQPTLIRFRRVPNFSASFNLGLFHNPFQAVTDNKLATPIGPGTLLGSQGLVVPMPFLQSIQTVDGSNAPLAPSTVFTTSIKPTAVTARLFDIRATVNAVGGAGPVWPDSGQSPSVASAIAAGQISNPAQPKNFTATDVGTNLGAGIQTWQQFSALNPSALEFRVSTSTAVTNPPFTRVDVIRQINAGTAAAEWEYLGQATFAGTLDQGGQRFFRYTFSYSGVNQGQFQTAALANGDVVRAVGSDVAGNGLSTLNTLVGQAPALGGGETITNTAITTPITNASAAQAITLAVTPNANSANLVFACSTNSSFLTAAMTSATTCTLTPNGVVAPAGSIPVTVTFTATGSQTGFSNNTITKNVSVTRTP